MRVARPLLVAIAGTVALALIAGAIRLYRGHAVDGPGQSITGVAQAEPAIDAAREARSQASRGAVAPVTRRDGVESPTSSKPVTPPAAPASMPAFDANVASYYDELSQRAKRGEDAAACRLGFELNACRQIPNLRRLQQMNERDASVATPGSKEAIQLTADALRIGADVAAREARCAGVDPAWFKQAPTLILQAARGGDLRAATAYAIAPPMDGANFLDDIAAWQTYAQQAPVMLANAAEHGNFTAVYAMRQAMMGIPVIFGSRDAIAPDPYRAVVYGTAVMPFVHDYAGRTIAAENVELKQQLGDARYAQAIREGQALSQRHYAAFEAARESGQWQPEHPERDCGAP